MEQATTADAISSGDLFSDRQGILKSLLAAAPFASLVGFRSLSVTVRFSLLDFFANFSFMLLLGRLSGLYLSRHRGTPSAMKASARRILVYRNTIQRTLWNTLRGATSARVRPEPFVTVLGPT